MINIEELMKKAEEARELSYSPYSKFKVGAVALMSDGKYILGANMENSSYPLAMCAERCCIYTAYMSGYSIDDFVAFAITGNTEQPISPCGACRQVMSELLPPSIEVYLFNLKRDMKIIKNSDLLPYSFSGEDL